MHEIGFHVCHTKKKKKMASYEAILSNLSGKIYPKSSHPIFFFSPIHNKINMHEMEDLFEPIFNQD